MIESETLELKKSLSQLREGIISLSSMLNKKKEGTLIFGINDDSKVVGLTIGKKTKMDITHEIQNNLKPLPSIVKIDDIIEIGFNSGTVKFRVLNIKETVRKEEAETLYEIIE